MKNWLLLLSATLFFYYACNDKPAPVMGATLSKQSVVILPNGDTLNISSKDTSICAVVTKYDTVVKKFKGPVITGPLPSTQPTWYANFESGIPNVKGIFNEYIQQADGTNLVTLSSDQAASGSKSCKFVLTKVNAAKKARCEMTMIGADVLKEGSERIYNFKFLSSDAPDYQYSVFQFHHKGRGRNPALYGWEGAK